MLKPGDLLQNRYRIMPAPNASDKNEPCLGRGGMGAVWLARDERLKCYVVVKETLVADTEDFAREAQLLANLHHPALPKVMDFFAQDDGQFLVMQYIEGEDLHGLVLRQEAPCRVAEVLDWANQLLDALDYLHTQTPPVLHRDIKPANIKLTSRKRIMLLDVGLAKGTVGLMSQHLRLHSLLRPARTSGRRGNGCA